MANVHLFPEFGELWFAAQRYHAATCISPSLKHLSSYFYCLFTKTLISKRTSGSQQLVIMHDSVGWLIRICSKSAFRE